MNRMTPWLATDRKTVSRGAAVVEKVMQLVEASGRRCWGAGLAIALGGTGLPLLSTGSAVGAESLSIWYGPLQASVPVSEVELYAQTGQMTGELANYKGFLSAVQLQQLRDGLQLSVPLSPTLVSQLLYSPTGERLLEPFGAILQRGDGQADLTALRLAIVQAAASPQGLTLPNVLRQYPAKEVSVRLDIATQMLGELKRRQGENQAWLAAVETQAQQQAMGEQSHRFALDLARSGDFVWQRLTMDWVDTQRRQGDSQRRGRPVTTDLYLPQRGDGTPLVVISHGVASNRTTLAYLAEHLASHGIAVALPEHSGSNGVKFQRYLTGLTAAPEPQEALDRPQDVTFVLDQLARMNHSDPAMLDEANLPLAGPLLLDRVVVIGQSFGAYTALTVGGAAIASQPSAAVCGGNGWEQLLNLSLLLQCRFDELKPPPGRSLKDGRVAAVLAVNPMVSQIFGQAGLAQLDVPTMVVSGGADFVVPPLQEQLYPFRWLTVPERYLVLMRNATHFSVLLEPLPEEKPLPITSNLIGPRADLAQGYLAALGLAFVHRYALGDVAYDPYLTSAYAQALSQSAMPLSLVRSLRSPSVAGIQ